MKKFSISILFVLLFIYSFVGVNSVIADENVSSVGNGVANYYVGSIIEEEELDFGVKYHNDSAYLNTTDSTYVPADCYAAGISKYGTEEFIMGKYYSANVNVLEVPNSEDIEIVPYANIDNGKWKLTTVEAMISNYEATHSNKKVIAAVNGDFFDMSGGGNYPYTSTGGTVSEGNYFKVNSSWKSIGFMNDGSNPSLIGNVLPEISSTPFIQILEDGKVVYESIVNGINKAASAGETTVYFTLYDSNHNPQAVSVNNAYIVTGDQIAPTNESSVYGLGEITNIGSCELDFNQFAVETSNAILKDYLKVGATIRVQYKYVGVLEGIDNVIGYPHNIILDGKPEITKDYRHPRTMVGMREDGTIIFTTIDGRQISRGYYGANNVEQAALMQYYGCVQAFNLDGGGSTTILIRQNGKFVVKNSPSDGSARSDGNCILIVAPVPVVNIETLNVTASRFDFKIDVIEMIEKYKDLYIALISEKGAISEKRKIGTELISYTGLEAYKDYTYKIYALVDGEYIGLPYTGVVNTAKVKYQLNNICLEKVVKADGKEYYHLSFEVFDDYKTVLMVSLRVNGKRVSIQKNEAYILVEDGCPINYVQIVVTYDFSDGLGRQDFAHHHYVVTFADTETAVNALFDNIDAKMNDILGE